MLAHVEQSVLDPQFGECELGMGYQIEGSLVDFSRTFRFTGRRLLEDGIVQPNVDESLPEALLGNRWHIEDCTLENGPRSGHIDTRLLLQHAVVEPKIVVQRLDLYSFLELVTTIRQNDILDLITRSELLLKGDELVS